MFAARLCSRTREGHLHPLTLFALTIVVTFQVFVADQNVYALVVILTFCVLIDASWAAFLRQLIAFACFYGILVLLLHVDLGYVTGFFIALVALVVRVFPIFNIGCVLMLTSPSKLLACLRLLRIPNNITIGVIIGLRFLDEIASRMKEIKKGMSIRGLRPNFTHPLRAFELYFVPLVYKCLHVSETLVSSIIAKGIEYEGEKTSYYDLTFRFIDGASLCIGIALLGVAIWM